jgi:hypothetical protein
MSGAEDKTPEELAAAQQDRARTVRNQRFAGIVQKSGTASSLQSRQGGQLGASRSMQKTPSAAATQKPHTGKKLRTKWSPAPLDPEWGTLFAHDQELIRSVIDNIKEEKNNNQYFLRVINPAEGYHFDRAAYAVSGYLEHNRPEFGASYDRNVWFKKLLSTCDFIAKEGRAAAEKSKESPIAETREFLIMQTSKISGLEIQHQEDAPYTSPEFGDGLAKVTNISSHGTNPVTILKRSVIASDANANSILKIVCDTFSKSLGYGKEAEAKQEVDISSHADQTPVIQHEQEDIIKALGKDEGNLEDVLKLQTCILKFSFKSDPFK